METWLNTLTGYKSKLGGKKAKKEGHWVEIPANLPGQPALWLAKKGIDVFPQTLTDDLENHLMVVLSCWK